MYTTRFHVKYYQWPVMIGLSLSNDNAAHKLVIWKGIRRHCVILVVCLELQKQVYWISVIS